MKTMISRRSFLCAAGIASASAVLTACGGSSSKTGTYRKGKRLFSLLAFVFCTVTPSQKRRKHHGT